jgi:hypothetical protein
MNKRFLETLIFGLSLSFSVNLWAQGPPITAETPIMLGLEGSGIRTFGRYISTEKSKNYVHVIGVPYNFSSKFQMGAVFPFVFKSPNESETVGGFGDMTIFAKYQVYKKDGKAKTFRILARMTQTFPTGKTSSEPPVGNDLMQTYIGLIFGQISSKVGIYGDVGYNATNKSAPDNWVYNFSFGIPLLPHQYPQKQVNAFLEMNGNYQLETKMNQFFLSPGLQWIPGRRFLVESSFQIPTFQNENGLNKTNFRWLLGIRFLIN